MKKCKTCGVEKAFAAFWRDAARKDGYAIHCRDCARIEQRKRRGYNLNQVPRVIDNKKQCTRCKSVKPLENFYTQKRGAGGRRSICKECQRPITRDYIRSRPGQHRARNLKKDFAMTLADYDALLIAQERKCAICRTDTPRGQGAFHVDHCHVTNQVRGLLCNTCNSGLGMFKDSLTLLDAAKAYLAKNRSS